MFSGLILAAALAAPNPALVKEDQVRLGSNLSGTVCSTETSLGATSPDLRRNVIVAAQQSIATSGLRPLYVRGVLEHYLSACHAPESAVLAYSRLPEEERKKARALAQTNLDGFCCPGAGDSYAAVHDLLAVVARLALQDVDPGAVDSGGGTAAIGPPPANPGGGGGADYRVPTH